ncbi:indolepyruvate ferredoxin oxidoreductase family protein [Methylocella sp.]|uniref:indolepyruvate ferredoxin oxidoreductase family protein n=1 Tax=Methylocella sp. TaxID=1978226 RepID=UPI0035B03D66
MAEAARGPGDAARAGTARGLAPRSLADRYDLSRERVFLTGSQAVVRLLLMQKARDRARGVSTAGYVSGYPGSPLGGLDGALLGAREELESSLIRFQPGLNEDLAATALWGAQQAEMRGEGRFDGVFGLWYGKGPGVDRSGDALRHANLAGTSRYGGVLALMGDDHTAESSTTAHQSDFAFVDAMMPVLAPAGAQELLDFGLIGFALSRYAGLWVGLKCVKEVIEATASVDASRERGAAVEPDDFTPPPGGLNIRARDPVLEQERRLHLFKLPAAQAFLRANRVDRLVTSGGRRPRIGVIAAGKSWLDVQQALDELGLDEARAADLGLRLYKVGCVYPLEPEGAKAFAQGLDLVIAVEEKRALIEPQLREALYDAPSRPTIVGKRDEAGRWLFPAHGALDPRDVALAIGRRLLRFSRDVALAERLDGLERAGALSTNYESFPPRAPYFCSGCPHNSSTRAPSGTRAYAGIGCHYMAQTMDRATEGYAQMGGEGANWVGEAPFSKRDHVIQNLGDGTYHHSGSLAIRFAVAAKANVTYKILYNGAIAMTGGQKLEGGLDAPAIARQVAAEGVARIAVVADDPQKYPAGTVWPQDVEILPREKLDAAQRALAEVPGVTVLIYDQMCATEKRRRRKRGTFPQPLARALINERVCEGCGDCGLASNCVSVQPLETELGRKRAIDQSSCNTDFSCLQGFCPALVTVRGARPKQPSPPAFDADVLPAPRVPSLGARPYGVLICGVGGSGVVTLGAILGMAAHIEGKASGALDMAGLAQKGGAVTSHVKIAARDADIHALRVGPGAADLLIGCDLLVAASGPTRAALRRGVGSAIVNSAELMPGAFTRSPDMTLPGEEMRGAIAQSAQGRAAFLDFSGFAQALFGDALAANMMLLGCAWQRGLLPLEEASLLAAIDLNGQAAERNRLAFAWGRRAAVDPAAVAEAAAAARPPLAAEPADFETLARRRAGELALYQDEAYAARYLAALEPLVAAERRVAPDSQELAKAGARALYKLMAVKDEYEVARLFVDGGFARQARAAFDGDLSFDLHLAPPFLARKGEDGRPQKRRFGPWILPVLGLLARMKRLRGTPLDLFGMTSERRLERRLVGDYERLIAEIATRLAPDNHALAVKLASAALKIRGFGHVKLKALEATRLEEARLLDQFRQDARALKIAAE